MSVYSGTNLVAGQGSDPGLQLAPSETDGPDHALLTKTFNDTQANLQSFIEQCAQNFRTRYALWSGQSDDGRKHRREGQKTDPTPWDGASDLQVFLVDEAVNSKVAMLSTAFRRAGISATPVEGNDIKRSKTVGNFMRWLVQTQIPEVNREVKLLCNYLQEHGIGAVGSFWEDTQEKILMTVTMADLQKQFPQLNLQQLIFADEAKDNLLAIFEEIYGCSKSKATKMLNELRQTQTTTVPTLGRKKSNPVIRAFNLNENLFIPDYSTDLEHAPGIFRVEHYTAEQLRAFANTSGWDSDWVEEAINRCKGKSITLTQNENNLSGSRSFQYQESNSHELIGVVFAYQRLSDEDGNTGTYLTIFNPHLPPDDTQDGYAKFGLLGYAHGQYPFVLFRREFLSRKLHDTRGIPEPGRPAQQQIKVNKDSLIDNASMQISPPMGFPQGRPPLRWGANARVSERRPGEYHYLGVPPSSPSNAASEADLQADFNRYCGFASEKTDPQFSALKNQDETEEFLDNWTKVFVQIYSLYRQFGSEVVYFRVVGLKQTDPVEFHKGQDSEEFDFKLTFDIGSLDADKQEKKLEALARVCSTFDKFGQIDYTDVLQIAVSVIDVNWAEQIISPAETGTQKVVDETHNMLAQVYSGVSRDINLNSPPQLVQQTIQNYAQAPDVQKRYREDPDFKARLDKLMKQTQMQLLQAENKKIGRFGA